MSVNNYRISKTNGFREKISITKLFRIKFWATLRQLQPGPNLSGNFCRCRRRCRHHCRQESLWKDSTTDYATAMPLPLLLPPGNCLETRLDIVIITRKKWQGIATHLVPYYTLSRVHSSRNQKILLGISFFIEFLSFHTKIMGCCKNRFGVVIFAELSFFSVTR